MEFLGLHVHAVLYNTGSHDMRGIIDVILVLVEVLSEILSGALSQTAHKVQLENDPFIVTFVFQAVDNPLKVLLTQLKETFLLDQAQFKELDAALFNGLIGLKLLANRLLDSYTLFSIFYDLSVIQLIDLANQSIQSVMEVDLFEPIVEWDLKRRDETTHLSSQEALTR